MARRTTKKPAPTPVPHSLAALAAEFCTEVTKLSRDVEHAYTCYMCALEDAASLGLQRALERGYNDLVDTAPLECWSTFAYMAREWSKVEV